MTRSIWFAAGLAAVCCGLGGLLAELIGRPTMTVWDWTNFASGCGTTAIMYFAAQKAKPA